MNIHIALFVLLVILSAAADSAAGDGAPVSVRPSKSEFAADETIEITVTNISADPIYLVPTFSSYPYDYFYPPDNYLEAFGGEYWRSLQRVRDITYYDKRLLFFELEPLESYSLTCSLSDFDDGTAGNPGTEFRAVVNVIVNPEAAVVSWQDFEKYGHGCQETIKSDAFTVTAAEEDPDEKE
jgi:hypothetical protein